MLHADLSLSLCPDLPIAAVHTVMQTCNQRCQNMEVTLEDGLAWEVPRSLPASAKTPEVRKPISRLACSNLTVMSFRDSFLKLQQPGVIEGHLAAAGWSVERWNDLRFWAGRHGHRTVPIEMGFSENDEQSVALQHSASEGSMRLKDFVMRFLLPSNTVLKNGGQGASHEAIDEWSASEVAYMAQHQLLLQIPELRSDILIPHYCALGELQTLNVGWGLLERSPLCITTWMTTFLCKWRATSTLASVGSVGPAQVFPQKLPRSQGTCACIAQKRESGSTQKTPREIGRKKHGASYSPVRVEHPDLEVGAMGPLVAHCHVWIQGPRCS